MSRKAQRAVMREWGEQRDHTEGSRKGKEAVGKDQAKESVQDVAFGTRRSDDEYHASFFDITPALTDSSSNKAQHLKSSANLGTARCTERKISSHSRRQRKPSTSEREKAEACLEANDERRLKKAVKRKDSKKSKRRAKRPAYFQGEADVVASMAATQEARGERHDVRKQRSERDQPGR
ncbi:hypothetical protein C8J56DRAFT_976784 [Mycena floridula]|nr:hypothetical protein C8J56DRAFT_976784 [Mycena floridula]